MLGPVQATRDGQPVPLGAPKQRALLAILALRPNTTVSIDELIDGLWGEDPPATAAKMVQLYVSQLRRVLADDAPIVTHGRGYELRLDVDAVDAARFACLVEAAGRNGTAGATVRQALSLWRGAPLADVADEPFAAAEVRRLDELRARASELAVEADIAAGREEEALAELERLIDASPLREGLYALRMRALYQSGRQAEALETYATARRRLVDELGIEPSRELRETHQRILAHDPALRTRPGGPPEHAERAPRPRAERTAEVPSSGTAVRRARPRRREIAGVAAVVVAGAVAVVLAIDRSEVPGHLAVIDEGAVGVIDPRARAIVAQFRIPGESRAVVAGAGSVWVASPSAGTVARLHRDGGRVDTIDVGGRPGALAFGGGSVWAADEESGRVAQIDPAANRVVQQVRLGNGLRAIAVGGDALWAAAGLDGEIVRFDIRSGRVTHRIAVGGRPTALAVSRDAIWAASEANGQVLRIDPATGVVLAAIAVGNGPSALAVGAGGVWTANRQDGTVSRIDPETDRVTTTARAGRSPSSLAVAGGALWIGDEAGQVRRLDGAAGGVSDSISTGSSPVGLASFDDDLWVIAAPPAVAHRGGTLRVAADEFQIDPAGFSDEYGVSELAYDGLVRYNRAPGAAGVRLAPGLAVDVPEPSDGGRRYVFRLARGLRYSDGTPLRAADVRASFERSIANLPADGVSGLDAVVGVERCGGAATACDLSAGVVTDERSRTVEIRLRHPDPSFLANLALPSGAVLPATTPRHAVERPIPGTGPYRVAQITRGRRVVLVRNPHFRPSEDGARRAGFADRVEVTMRSDDRWRIAAVERGALDLAPFRLHSREIAGLRARFGSRLWSGSFQSTMYAWLNVREPPFNDRRVRRALSLAVDRRRAVEVFGGPDFGAPTCQLLPPGLPGYRPLCTSTADPSPAGAWTASDRWRARAMTAGSAVRGTRVEVWVKPEWRSLGQHVADVLRDLGFRGRVRVFDDLGPLLEAAQDPREHPQIGLVGWVADSPEPANFLRPLVGCEARRPDRGGFNLSGFCDRGIDAAIDRAEAAGLNAGPAWHRIERRLDVQMPVIPLLNARYPVVVSKRLGNLQFHTVSGPLLDQVWVK